MSNFMIEIKPEQTCCSITKCRCEYPRRSTVDGHHAPDEFFQPLLRWQLIPVVDSVAVREVRQNVIYKTGKIKGDTWVGDV